MRYGQVRVKSEHEPEIADVMEGVRDTSNQSRKRGKLCAKRPHDVVEKVLVGPF